MVQRGLSSFKPKEVILTHERKVYKHEAKLSASRSDNLNVVAGLPVPMDYDCVYDSI